MSDTAPEFKNSYYANLAASLDELLAILKKESAGEMGEGGLSKEEAMANVRRDVQRFTNAELGFRWERPCYLTIQQQAYVRRMDRELERIINAGETSISEELRTAMTLFITSVDPKHPWLKRQGANKEARRLRRERRARRSERIKNLPKRKRDADMEMMCVDSETDDEHDDDETEVQTNE